MLRGTDANEVIHERNHASLLHKVQLDTCVEDDVEFPNFANKDEITYTSEKASVADNHLKMNPFSFRGNTNGVCTWLAENAEADALVNENDDSDCASFHSLSSKLKRSSKGGQGKAKRKFSIRAQSHDDSLFKDSSGAYESHTSIKGKEMDGMTNHMMPAGFPISHTHSTTSVTELLLRVQDERDIPEVL
ncbi:uncharacterized protein LOC143574396 [Bidens hawaiensis]|uniref:uncharacterized protein LOC143574396 n=1 Tax=Bidens hawaiensis TaxID=980011 RepID=UPI004049A6B5